jgi:PQQ-dependent dehydrogenase (methanol/ethanol family)
MHFFRAVISSCLVAAAVGSLAEEGWDTIEAGARKAIVSVRVIGKIEGRRVTEVGTGFLVQTKDGPRVITAGHVVGADDKWDDVQEREIHVRQPGLGSSISADPVFEAKVEPDADIAQVYLEPYDVSTLVIANTNLIAGGNFDVGSWGTARTVKFQVVELLSVRDLPNRMRLSGNYETSHSGSPVLDNQGRVAGMLVERALSIDSPPVTIGFALPAQRLMQALGDVTPVPHLKTQLRARDSLDFARLGGCVLLGKRSATNSKEAPVEAEIFSALQNSAGRSSVARRPVKLISRVDLRSRCPLVIDGVAYYGRVITELLPGDSILIKEVRDISYAEDTYYWADVDRVLPAAGQPHGRNGELIALSEEPKNWVMPTGNYANHRYSALKQITADNVGKLQVAWTFSTGVLRGHEGGPLVIGDVMYVHGPFPNPVYALDLNNDAKILWKYEPKQDPSVVSVMCCDTVNRGLAYADGKIFLHQADTTLVALDAKDGKVVWQAENGDPSKGETGTSAPMVIKDKVLIGISGGEFGVQCHMTAYDLQTGRRVWRAYSVGPDDQLLVDPDNTTELGKPIGKDSSLKTWQGDQWRTGGGCAYGWISYDPQLNLLYYGSGNPSPWNSKQRPGDNKWSMTIFARDPDTGIARWLYQMTPHDEWDYDGISEMILTEQNIRGIYRRTLVHFDRNGFAYTLDRTNGELLVAEKYDPTVNWAAKVDMDKNSRSYGRPQAVPQYSTEHQGQDSKTEGICPAGLGTKSVQPAAYSQDTGLFYVPTAHTCMNYEPFPVAYAAGQPYVGATISFHPPPGKTNLGNFIAWDAKTGKIVWSLPEQFSVWSGALATAGGVVFYGTLEGYLKAIDAKTGKELYKFKTPAGIIGNVTTYEHRGKQYIAVLSGGVGPTSRLATGPTSLGGQLTVFRISDTH